MTAKIDISHEFMICRYLNGFTLLPRESPKLYVEPVATVADVLQASFSVFFTIDSVIKEINDACLTSVCADSKSEVIEHSYSTLSSNMLQTKKIMAHDNWVMQQKTQKVFEEKIDLIEGDSIHVVSFKAPWYGNTGKLVGIFGCSVPVCPHNIMETIHNMITLSNLFMLPADAVKSIQLGQQINGKYFSPREMDIIPHIIQGRTLREIATILALSPRTVESYFENMKAKIGVSSRSQFSQYIHTLKNPT